MLIKVSFTSTNFELHQRNVGKEVSNAPFACFPALHYFQSDVGIEFYNNNVTLFSNIRSKP